MRKYLAGLLLLSACNVEDPEPPDDSGGGGTDDSADTGEPVSDADADDDGIEASVDCDDLDPAVGLPVEWYVDCDGDAAWQDEPVTACEAPTSCPTGGGTLANSGTDVPTVIDCDDTTSAVSPSAVEICEDLVDQDCDGLDGVCELETLVLDPGDHLRITEAEAGDGLWFAVPYDIDGDGQQDLVISSPNYPLSAPAHSKLHVVYGPITSNIDLATNPNVILGDADSCLGTRLAVDDVLGNDGVPEILAIDGCRRVNGGSWVANRVLVYPGNLTGTLDDAAGSNALADIRLPDGYAISGGVQLLTGNLVGSSDIDLVVQSSRSGGHSGTVGHVWVVEGPLPAGVTELALDPHYSGSAAAPYLGETMAIRHGDPDGNGYDDLYMGSWRIDATDDGSVDQHGAVLQFLGPLDRTPGEAWDKTTDRVIGNHRCGRLSSLLPAADGLSATLTAYSPDDTYAGAAGACGLSGSEGLAATVALPLAGTQRLNDIATASHLTGADHPASATPIGDLNRDGQIDHLFRSRISGSFGTFDTFYLFMGPVDETTTLDDARWEFEPGPYRIAPVFTPAGDLTGDGHDDLLVRIEQYPTSADRMNYLIIEGPL